MNDSASWFKTHRKLAIGSILFVAIVATLFGSMLSVANYEQLAAEHGEDAVRMLQSTGYPRATDEDVETYTFINVGPGGEEVTFLIDWRAHNVTVIPRPEGESSLTARLPEDAYDRVTARLESVRRGELVSPTDKWSTAWSILTDTDVEIRGKTDVGDGLWKTKLAMWATTIVLRSETGGLTIA